MVIAVIGMQWGDEGKGKFIDFLSKEVDWVIRYAGGANAGHTIVHNTTKFSFHLLPTGILNPNTKVLLGPAMVIDPEQMCKELAMLDTHNIDWANRIFISDRAHLVLPSYKKEDEYLENNRKNRLGTTKKGIGIAYAKRALRTGIRIADIDDIENSDIVDPYDIEFIKKNTAFLHTMSVNHFICLDHIEKDENILYEGAQGTMLDMDIGSYPFVTSGPTALNGVYSCGTPHGKVDEVLGVIKAYTSRVGEGPFPSEYIESEIELRKFIQKVGDEVGTTTGRLRRCGHLDLVALRFASTIVGISSLAITHVDVLDTLENIKVCVGYELNGQIIDYLPTSLTIQSKLKPVFKNMKGWQTDTSKLTKWSDIPQEMLRYFELIETIIKVPITMVSVGPERTQSIVKKNFLLGWLN